MTDAQFDDLEGRLDGIARVLMCLIADLEIRENLDGDRFGQAVRRAAQERGSLPGREVCVHVMEQIAGQLDDARRRRSAGH